MLDFRDLGNIRDARVFIKSKINTTAVESVQTSFVKHYSRYRSNPAQWISIPAQKTPTARQGFHHPLHLKILHTLM